MAGARVSAWQIDPFLWQQLVERSHFVGVVECTTAGGIVARYRVIEVWKGREASGDEIDIRISFDFLEQGYPVAVVGERAFVTLFRSDPPSSDTGIDGVDGEPTARRNLPADYQIPLGQGYYRLPPRGAPSGDEVLRLDEEQVRLAELREKARSFLASSDEARALISLRALIDKYFARSPQLTESHFRIKESKSLDVILESLRDAWDRQEGHERDLIEKVVYQSAESHRRRMRELARSTQDVRHTIAKGETLDGIARKYLGSRREALDISKANRDVLESASRIKAGTTIEVSARQGLVSACLHFDPKPSPQLPVPTPLAASADKLDAAERVFSSAPEQSTEFSQAAYLLIRHRPMIVASWLKNWKVTSSHAGHRNRSYQVGSWFAANCGGDRRLILTQMLEATEPVVRTAAAVYLTFEDEQMGLARLRELIALPGDAGAWAAVTLMRYGDRTAVPRALEFLELPTGIETRPTMLHWILVGRLYEILSNTAAANSLPTPVLQEQHAEVRREKAAPWARDLFAQNPRIIPVDPWLPELRRRKVD